MRVAQHGPGLCRRMHLGAHWDLFSDPAGMRGLLGEQLAQGPTRMTSHWHLEGSGEETRSVQVLRVLGAEWAVGTPSQCPPPCP